MCLFGFGFWYRFIGRCIVYYIPPTIHIHSGTDQTIFFFFLIYTQP